MSVVEMLFRLFSGIGPRVTPLLRTGMEVSI